MHTSKISLTLLLLLCFLLMGYSKSQPADKKTVPYEMREYEVSVTTSVVCVDPFMPGVLVNHFTLVSDEPLYVSLEDDAITGHAGAAEQTKAKRLKHAGEGSKVFIQNRGFDTVCLQSRGSATTVDIIPGGFST